MAEYAADQNITTIDRVRRALATGVAGDFGDHELNPDLAAISRAQPLKPAAVLVPIIDHPGGPTVLMTVRSAHLNSHAGQIAFPGGKIDAEDASVEAAAQREATEEVGLPASYVENLGRLGVYKSFSGFEITPVVARIEPGFDLQLNPSEVDEAFEVPYDFVMNRQNHQLFEREWRGKVRQTRAVPYGRFNIWGVTASILHHMSLVLHPDD